MFKLTAEKILKLREACNAVEKVKQLPVDSLLYTVGKTDEINSGNRFLVFWVGFNVNKLPICVIKKFFGFKSHGTIINGIKKVDEWRDVMPGFSMELNEVLDQLGIPYDIREKLQL